MIDPLQIYLVIPRSFELIVYTICAFLLLNKQKSKTHSDPGNYLRFIYILAFLSWTIYMILDISTSLIIAISITPQYISSLPSSSFPVKYIGYFSGFPSVTLANILRDIQMMSAISMVILTYIATQVIKYGKSLAIEKMKDIKKIIFFALAGFSMVFFDMKEVEFKNSNPNSIIVSGSWDSLGVEGYLGFFLYIGIISYSTTIMLILYFKNSNNVDKHIKRKLLGFNIGYIFLCAGMWYWVLYPEFDLILSLNINPIISETIGHFLWVMAPISFYFALRSDNYQIIKK